MSANPTSGESKSDESKIPVHVIKNRTDDVRSVLFSPDGTRIVSGSDDSTVRVWDAVSGQCVHTLKGHTNWVNSVSWDPSPGSNRIVSGSWDDTVRVWDAVSGQCVLGPLVGHTNWVTSVSFSPDGLRIVSGSFDGTLRVWDADVTKTMTDRCIKILHGHEYAPDSVSWDPSPGSDRIVSGGEGKTVWIWDASTGVVLHKLRGHTSHVRSVSFSPDGKRIVSASGDSFNYDDKTLLVWNASTGILEKTLTGHATGVRSVSFSLDGKHIVSGAYDKTVRVWDANPTSDTYGKCVHTLEGHAKIVMSVSFSPNSARIVSGAYDGTILVWDIIMMEFYQLRKEIVKFITTMASMRNPRAVVAMRVVLKQEFLTRLDTLVARASADRVDIPELQKLRTDIIKFKGITTDGGPKPAPVMLRF